MIFIGIGFIIGNYIKSNKLIELAEKVEKEKVRKEKKKKNK